MNVASVIPLHIGVSKENLEKHHPSNLGGEFLKDSYTQDELVDAVVQHDIDVLMVDVFDAPFTDLLLRQLKGRIKLINFLYQSIESLIDQGEAARCGIEVRKLPENTWR